MRHKFKSWPPSFQQILDGTKAFEIRKADRPDRIKVGDELQLKEWNNFGLGSAEGPVGFTGREALVKVGAVLHSWDLPREWGLLKAPNQTSAGFTIASITLIVKVRKGGDYDQQPSQHVHGDSEPDPAGSGPEAVHGDSERPEHEGQGGGAVHVDEREIPEDVNRNTAVDQAEEHWAWLGGLIENIGGQLFMDAFVHGHKHGREDEQQEYIASLGRVLVGGGSERLLEVLSEAVRGVGGK